MSYDRELEVLTLGLYDAGAIKIDTKEGFRLKLHEQNPNAPLSPIYFNLRTPDNPKPGPVTPFIMKSIGRLLWELAQAEGIYLFDAVAGLPNAGKPIADAFVAAMRKTLPEFPSPIELEKTERRKISGIRNDQHIPAGSPVLVIDDLISEANTKIEGIDTLVYDGGYTVSDVLVLIDREQGGGEILLEKRDASLHSALKHKKILEILLAHGKITPAQSAAVHQYLQQPSRAA